MDIIRDIAYNECGFVFSSSNGKSFTVNSIGLEIIQMLEQDRSIKQINQFLNSKYDADILTIDNEVSDFIDLLHQYSIIDNKDAA